MMRTYEFDDAVSPPGRFRFPVLRTLAVGKFREELVIRQKGKCALGNHRPGRCVHVDHKTSVKDFAYDLTIPLTEAYLRCHALDNLQAVCARCNNARNRKRKT